MSTPSHLAASAAAIEQARKEAKRLLRLARQNEWPAPKRLSEALDAVAFMKGQKSSWHDFTQTAHPHGEVHEAGAASQSNHALSTCFDLQSDFVNEHGQVMPHALFARGRKTVVEMAYHWDREHWGQALLNAWRQRQPGDRLVILGDFEPGEIIPALAQTLPPNQVWVWPSAPDVPVNASRVSALCPSDPTFSVNILELLGDPDAPVGQGWALDVVTRYLQKAASETTLNLKSGSAEKLLRECLTETQGAARQNSSNPGTWAAPRFDDLMQTLHAVSQEGDKSVRHSKSWYAWEIFGALALAYERKPALFQSENNNRALEEASVLVFNFHDLFGLSCGDNEVYLLWAHLVARQAVHTAPHTIWMLAPGRRALEFAEYQRFKPRLKHGDPQEDRHTVVCAVDQWQDVTRFALTEMAYDPDRVFLARSTPSKLKRDPAPLQKNHGFDWLEESVKTLPPLSSPPSSETLFLFERKGDAVQWTSGQWKVDPRARWVWRAAPVVEALWSRALAKLGWEGVVERLTQTFTDGEIPEVPGETAAMTVARALTSKTPSSRRPQAHRLG